MTGFGVRVERLHCPLSSCEWTHDRTPGEATHTPPGGVSPLRDGPPATLQEAIADAAYAILLADLLEVESVLREHLETHTLLEWVQEVTRLQSEVAALSGSPRSRFTAPQSGWYEWSPGALPSLPDGSTTVLGAGGWVTDPAPPYEVRIERFEGKRASLHRLTHVPTGAWVVAEDPGDAMRDLMEKVAAQPGVDDA